MLLLEHDVPHSAFSEAVLSFLPKLPWVITEEASIGGGEYRAVILEQDNSTELGCRTEHDVPHSAFSEAVLNFLPKLPWVVTEEASIGEV